MEEDIVNELLQSKLRTDNKRPSENNILRIDRIDRIGSFLRK